MSVCPSVRLSVPPPNSLQTQHIDLKLSTLLFEAKSGAKFEKSDKILFMSWVPHRNQSWVYGAKKLFCPNDLKFSTLVYLLIRNDF